MMLQVEDLFGGWVCNNYYEHMLITLNLTSLFLLSSGFGVMVRLAKCLFSSFSHTNTAFLAIDLAKIYTDNTLFKSIPYFFMRFQTVTRLMPKMRAA